MPGGFQDFAELETISVTLVHLNGRDVPIERLIALGALNSLPDHVDGTDEFPAFGRVLREDLRQIQLAFPSLGQEAAAHLLGAIVPEAGIQSRVTPADGAIPLDVPDQIRFGGLSRQG